MAAITIVSYTGITAKANATKALSNAQSVQNVVEIFNAEGSNVYPADAAAIMGYTTGTAKVPTGITVVAAAQNVPTNATTGVNNGLAYVSYLAKGTTGGCIAYYDFSNNPTPGLKYVFVGNATTANFTLSTPTCS
ncbi:hypothetical protein CVV43_00815 [Candidatus Saccharibacteria bacterium HGW-Saccharibacteria-1]|nr:MAG: hypothetical protein CVV43_00815 [Candidatus Saccharibacteria bacterium HGW-Saccharibacteria-1]